MPDTDSDDLDNIQAHRERENQEKEEERKEENKTDEFKDIFLGKRIQKNKTSKQRKKSKKMVRKGNFIDSESDNKKKVSREERKSLTHKLLMD